MNQSPATLDSPPRAPTQPSRAGTLSEGSLFAGRYQIVRCLAVGGMGSIYEVVHVETNRRRALKVMHPHLFQSDEMRERFKREARISADVESEYIVDVADAGVDEATKTPFLVMELLQGEELGHRIRRLGRLPPTEVMAYLHQVALALDKTHAKMIVHRDLKPDNVFLTLRDDGSPRVKILDFGVAKLVREGSTGAGTRSLGTPLYMAPEQFRTSSRLTPAADIYALGMMAYTLLVGEAYWDLEANASEDVIAFAMTAIHGPQEPATRRAERRGVKLPPAFDAWFSKICSPNPSDRPVHATEAIRALGEVLGVDPGDKPMVVPLVPTPPQAVTAPMRSPPFMPTAALPDHAIATTGPGASPPPHTTTSTGVSLEPPKSSPPHRWRLVLSVAVPIALAAGGIGGWLVFRSAPGPSVATEPQTAVVTASADTTVATGTLPAPTVAPADTETVTHTTAEPAVPGSGAPTARPPQTGTLPTAAPAGTGTRPVVTATARPTTRPTATATATKPPLIGRD